MKFVKLAPRGNDQKRFQEKLFIVMNWLAEFRFSSIEFLASILGQHPDQMHIFFKRLRDERYIVDFEHPHFPRMNLVRISRFGADYIRKYVERNPRNYLRSDIFECKKSLLHDYKLQLYIHSCRHVFDGALYEPNIIADKPCPDALLFQGEECNATKWDLTQPVSPPPDILEKQEVVDFDSDRFTWFNPKAPIAVEFEDSRKSGRRVRTIFLGYLNAITSGRLSGVHYVFDSASLLSLYQKQFDKIEWDSRTISSAHPARRGFHFTLLAEPSQ